MKGLRIGTAIVLNEANSYTPNLKFMSIVITLLYVIVPILLLFGVMYLIRRKREQNLSRDTNKVSDIKAEDTKD